MTKLLITPTLLNSFAFYTQEIEYKSEEEQRQEFLQTLKRVKSEPTEAMQRGIDFENDVFNICNDGFASIDKGEEYNNVVNKIAYLVKQGLWQQVVKKDIVVGNQEFLLYGKCDVVKANTIYDIKFTSNYDIGKYLNSSQHLIYLYCSGLSKFQYLISDGKSYWIEDYYNDSNIENNIKSKINEFIGYLENDKQAKTIYFENWRSK
jgi:hypothetical protein